MTNTTFRIGDRVIIQNRGSGWDDITGVVTSDPDILGRSDREDPLYVITYDDPDSTPFGFATGRWSAQFLNHRAPELPKAALAHQTSREYAAEVNSPALPEHFRSLLSAAADGEEVDVFDFRLAATRALSQAASLSTGRTVRARQARHLIHWADAILENHLKGLPVYEGGPRSPKIHALEQEIADIKQAASDERRRLVEEIEDAKRAFRDVRRELERAHRSEQTEVGRTTALIREKTALEIEVEDLKSKALADMQHLYRECNEFHAALEYAFGLLGEEGKTRLAGFRDGYATRCNDVPTPEH